MKPVTQLMLPVAIALLLASSCADNDSCCTPDPGPSLNQLDFNELAVGQQSHYLLLHGEGYFQGDANNFVYLDDTLSLEVISEDPAKGFEVEERMYYKGDLMPTWLDTDRDSVYHYFLQVSDDTLRVLPKTGSYTKSRIFKRNKLPLAAITNPEASIQGWITNLPYCECDRQAFVKNYTQFGRIYPKLNLEMHNSPMALDGPGATFVYSATDGMVRFTYVSWWTQSGYGFDLLP